MIWLRDRDGSDGWPPCSTCAQEQRREHACPLVPPVERAEIAVQFGPRSAAIVERQACPASYARSPFAHAIARYFHLAKLGMLDLACAPDPPPAIVIDGIAHLDAQNNLWLDDRRKDAAE